MAVATGDLKNPASTAERSAQVSQFGSLARREQWRYVLLLVPGVVFLIIFYGYPVAAMLSRSFTDPVLGLQNFEPLVQARSTIDFLGLSIPMNAYIRIFGITLQIALVTTLATLALGYPVAYALSSTTPARANLLMILVLIPFWTSILVRSYAWMVLLGQQGIINEALLAANVVQEPIQLLNTRLAVYLGMIHILLPFMILPLYSVMRTIDPRYVRAAKSLGATSWTAFRRVYLPLTLPGVGAGGLLVFILAIGYYITPALVGGAEGQLISNLIALHINKTLNWSLAASLSGLLLLAVLILYWLYDRLVGIDKLKLG